MRLTRPALMVGVGGVLVATGCAAPKVFAPPAGEESYAKMTVKFLNVRHEPGAPWGRKGFRPRLEICDGGKPGCGITWCYECEGHNAESHWKISETSVAAELHVPSHEITIVPYTREGDDECRAEPLVIAPKQGVEYELVYSHVRSGPSSSSYRCAATVERKQIEAKAPAADHDGSEGSDEAPSPDDAPSSEAPPGT